MKKNISASVCGILLRYRTCRSQQASSVGFIRWLPMRGLAYQLEVPH